MARSLGGVHACHPAPTNMAFLTILSSSATLRSATVGQHSTFALVLDPLVAPGSAQSTSRRDYIPHYEEPSPHSRRIAYSPKGNDSLSLGPRAFHHRHIRVVAP